MCASSRILWIKFKFSRVKVCVVVRYSPSEGEGEERERFWNDMDRILDRVGNGSKWMERKYGESRHNWCFWNSRIMMMVEEWRSSVLKGDCIWVTHTLSTGVCISTQGWQGVKME